jgi:hypothetical protein
MSAALFVGLIALSTSCASAVPSQPEPQDSSREVVLKLGSPARVPNTNLTIAAEAVVEDSRCPTGVSCVWEGDAAIRIRITTPDAPAATYTLHTNDQFAREVVHGGSRVRLISVAPHPTATSKPTPDEYRVTLSITRK